MNLRAIFLPNLAFYPEENKFIFEYDTYTDKFKMITDEKIQYDVQDIIEDNSFIVFTSQITCDSWYPYDKEHIVESGDVDIIDKINIYEIIDKIKEETNETKSENKPIAIAKGTILGSYLEFDIYYQDYLFTIKNNNIIIKLIPNEFTGKLIQDEITLLFGWNEIIEILKEDCKTKFESCKDMFSKLKIETDLMVLDNILDKYKEMED